MLNRFQFLALVTALAVAEVNGSAFRTGASADEKAKAAETTEVKLMDLTLKLPKSWKALPNTSTMRLATYEIPKADGDPEAGELSVFSFAGGGGGLADNLTRWVGQFSSEGRKAVIRKGEAGSNKYYIADITGTYQKPKGPPVLRQTEPAPGFRMLGVVIELEGKGVYYLKLTGPDATVKAQADALRASFGGDAKTEADYEI